MKVRLHLRWSVTQSSVSTALCFAALPKCDVHLRLHRKMNTFRRKEKKGEKDSVQSCFVWRPRRVLINASSETQFDEQSHAVRCTRCVVVRCWFWVSRNHSPRFASCPRSRDSSLGPGTCAPTGGSRERACATNTATHTRSGGSGVPSCYSINTTTHRTDCSPQCLRSDCTGRVTCRMHPRGRLHRKVGDDAGWP